MNEASLAEILRPHDFPQNGLLASAVDVSASLRHRRPTSRPSKEGWKDACMHGYFREEKRRRKGRPFSQQRKCKSNFNAGEVSRRSRSHRFRGLEGNHVREGSLSRGRIDAELGGRAAPAEWRALRIGVNCAHFSSLTGENTEAMFEAGKSKS